MIFGVSRGFLGGPSPVSSSAGRARLSSAKRSAARLRASEPGRGTAGAGRSLADGLASQADWRTGRSLADGPAQPTG